MRKNTGKTLVLQKDQTIFEVLVDQRVTTGTDIILGNAPLDGFIGGTANPFSYQNFCFFAEIDNMFISLGTHTHNAWKGRKKHLILHHKDEFFRLSLKDFTPVKASLGHHEYHDKWDACGNCLTISRCNELLYIDETGTENSLGLFQWKYWYGTDYGVIYRYDSTFHLIVIR